MEQVTNLDTARQIRQNMLEECQKAINSIPQDKFPLEVTLAGRKFICHEGVFGSDIDYAFPGFLASIPVGKRMLEIGTGTGGFMASLYLDRPGAIDSILATDINPRAIENAKENFAKYDIPAEVRVSDVFGSISKEEKFDAIFWNAPYLFTEKELSMLDKSLADTKYQYIDIYIRDADLYLKEGGRVSFSFSRDAGEWEVLENILSKHKKKVRQLWESEEMVAMKVRHKLQLLELLDLQQC